MCLSARLLIDKSALIAAYSMRQLREAINQHFKVAIRRPVHVCPDIPRVSQGTRWKSYLYSASISNLRGAGHPAALRRCSSSRVPPRVSFIRPPTALFLDLLSARRLARDAATWQS